MASLVALAQAACTPLSLTLFAVGASAGISHQTNGPAYKTFTAPMPRVKFATRLALKRMAIRVQSVERTGSGEILYGLATDRRIEVQIEALTATVTRVRAVARTDVLLVDAATAAEIIVQTQKALGT